MEQPVSSGQPCSCETESQATFRSHKHVLGQIDSDADNLHGGLLLPVNWLLETPVWHFRCRLGEEESIPLLIRAHAFPTILPQGFRGQNRREGLR